ncbi:MAG: lipopolysaccharide heptosyltransferase II [bacterium]
MEGIERILVIKLSSIGDVVLVTPALRHLRRAYPKAKISFLVEREASDIVRHNPNLDELIIFDRTEFDLRGFARIARHLRDARFDLAIDFQGLARSALFVYLSGARYRVGLGRWPGYFRNIPHDRGRVRHAVVSYREVIRSMNIIPEGRDELELHIGPEERARGDRLWKESGLEGDRGVAILNPGAKWETKRWPTENFISLGRRLKEEGYGVALIGSEQDLPTANRIAEELRNAANFAGRATLGETAAIISRGDVFITGDTGPMHIAMAVGTPVVALFGPTDPARTGPWGEHYAVVRSNSPCPPCLRRRCPLKTLECMRGIDVEAVYEKAEDFLKSWEGINC